jgi:hypothetical protein
MRSIALAVLIGGMVPGLALAQDCRSGASREANLLLAKQQVLTAPIGRRYVVSAQWTDQPAKVEGETRITSALYQDLNKLGTNGAVRVDRIKHKNQGWYDEDIERAVQKGFSSLVDVAPGTISSEPTYREQGDSFSVDRFAYTNLQLVSVNQLKSAADHYCVVQFTYRVTYTPRLSVLNDEPGNAQRKGRLLSVVDPFDRGWRILAYDLAPQDRDFATTRVTDGAASLSLTR